MTKTPLNARLLNIGGTIFRGRHRRRRVFYFVCAFFRWTGII